jgi:hypothetical protein
MNRKYPFFCISWYEHEESRTAFAMTLSECLATARIRAGEALTVEVYARALGILCVIDSDGVERAQ